MYNHKLLSKALCTCMVFKTPLIMLVSIKKNCTRDLYIPMNDMFYV